MTVLTSFKRQVDRPAAMTSESDMNQPQVGIWWDDGETLVALTHPFTENVACVGGRIDSDLAHIDEWPNVARNFGMTEDDEYFSVPRGRVLLVANTPFGLIFHGSATGPSRLAVIAHRFALTDWKAEIDTHYLTGVDADRLFDD